MSVYLSPPHHSPPRTDHDLYRCGRFTARPEFMFLGLVGAWEGSVVCLSNWSESVFRGLPRLFGSAS